LLCEVEAAVMLFEQVSTVGERVLVFRENHRGVFLDSFCEKTAVLLSLWGDNKDAVFNVVGEASEPLLEASISSSSRFQNTSFMLNIPSQNREKSSPMSNPQPSHGIVKSTKHCSVSKGFLSNTGKVHLLP